MQGLYDALRLLDQYTGGRIDPWGIAGRDNAKRRAFVMSALMGRKVPQAQSGVSAITAELYRRAGIVGNCEAERMDNLREYARSMLAEVAA